MMSCSGLHSYADLAMAMLTSISALSEEYKREDLAEKLHSNLKKRSLLSNRRLYVYIFYYTNYLNSSVLKVQKNLYFSEPILDTNGLLQVNNTTPLDIWDISNNELIITGEDNEYAFMSIYDSFTTLLLAKEENIEYIVHSMNVEAIICDKKNDD